MVATTITTTGRTTATTVITTTITTAIGAWAAVVVDPEAIRVPVDRPRATTHSSRRSK